MAAREVQDGSVKQMAEVLGSTAEEMARQIAAENAKWTGIIIDAGIKAS